MLCARGSVLLSSSTPSWPAAAAAAAATGRQALPVSSAAHPPLLTRIQAVAGDLRASSPQPVGELKCEQLFRKLGQRVGVVGAVASLLRQQRGIAGAAKHWDSGGHC